MVYWHGPLRWYRKCKWEVNYAIWNKMQIGMDLDFTWSLSNLFQMMFDTKRMSNTAVNLVHSIGSRTRWHKRLGLFRFHTKTVANIRAGHSWVVDIGARSVIGSLLFDLSTERIGWSMGQIHLFTLIRSGSWIVVWFGVICFRTKRVADALFKMDLFCFVGAWSWRIVISCWCSFHAKTVSRRGVLDGLFRLIGTRSYYKKGELFILTKFLA